MLVNVFGRVLHIHTTTKSYTPKKKLYKSLTLFVEIFGLYIDEGHHSNCHVSQIFF